MRGRKRFYPRCKLQGAVRIKKESPNEGTETVTTIYRNGIVPTNKKRIPE